MTFCELVRELCTAPEETELFVTDESRMAHFPFKLLGHENVRKENFLNGFVLRLTHIINKVAVAGVSDLLILAEYEFVTHTRSKHPSIDSYVFFEDVIVGTHIIIR